MLEVVKKREKENGKKDDRRARKENEYKLEKGGGGIRARG